MRIFLSYRREDASGHAGRLYDALASRFGAENVFMDIDTIDLGADFVNVITEAVASCDVLIALIGRQWLTAADAEGRRRLDTPDDFVRLELDAALKRDVFVIPACVQGAAQPSPEQLPHALASLARRHGTDLRDIGWHDDVKRLVERLERFERENSERAGAPEPATAGADVPPPRPLELEEPQGGLRNRLRSRRALLVLALVVAVLAAAAIAAVLASRGDDGGPTATSHFPNAVESRLLQVIPAITRPSCQRIDYGEKAALTSLECSGARLAVTYHLFPNNAVMDAWYVQQRELAEIEPLSGTCTGRRFRGEARYVVAGKPVGREFCYFDSEGDAQLRWTDGRSGVGAQANIWEGKGRPAAESLLRQWRCCLRVEAATKR